MSERGSSDFVSVIVPSRNRAGFLADCLKALIAQDHPRDLYEVIVVDDASTDDTAALMRQFSNREDPRVHCLRQPTATGPAGARNAGIDTARGDLLCFVDDDILAPPQWVGEMVTAARRYPEAGCFAGRITLLAEGPVPRSCGREPLGESELELGDKEHAVSYGLTGGNMAIRRAALSQIGPFDSSLPFYGEDTEWQHRLTRAGGTTIYLPGAWVQHRRTAAELKASRILRRQFRKGRAWPLLAPYLHRRVSVVGGVRVIAEGIAHAVRYRCWVGIFRAAHGLGHAWEGSSRLVRGQRSPYLRWFPDPRRAGRRPR